jgi:hypothetical protein
MPRVALMVHYCRYLGHVLDSYALMRFEPLAPVLIPPRYEMLRILGPEEEVPDLPFVEQPLRATCNPRVWVMSGEPWSTPVNKSAEEPNSVSVDSHRWVSLPFGVAESPASVQRRIERGLYVGPVDLYRAEGDSTLSYTQVAVRAVEPPVAPAGYSILPGDPQRVMGVAAELAAAVHGLTAAPPAEPDVSWEELPWAFMATVATAEGGPAERPDHWASMDRRWDRNMAAEGQGPEEVRTRLPARVTILCLFGGLCSELEGWLRTGLHFGKVLYVDSSGPARRITEARFRTLQMLYPRQLPPTAVEGFLTALPLQVEEVGEQELAPHGEIHLVTVSSPCQGMSRANRNALGLQDRRSKCVEEAWRILTLLSERQARPSGYTFELVDARDHPSAKAHEGFTTFVQMAAGDSEGFVAVDAAKLGSPAHRVRVFYTNLAPVAGIR